jgi:hypothetical protein
VRFFELEDDVHVAGRWHLGQVLGAGGEEPRLRAGIAYVGGELSGWIDKPGGELDFQLTSFAVPVLRTRLAAKVECIAGQDIQRIPLALRGHDGFEVMNALRTVACLDEERAEFTKWTEMDRRPDKAGHYRMVTRLRIDVGQVPREVDIFRVEGWLVALIVSERLKAAMEAVGSRGARFVEV